MLGQKRELKVRSLKSPIFNPLRALLSVASLRFLPRLHPAPLPADIPHGTQMQTVGQQPARVDKQKCPCIARQPILTRDEAVFAYKLLFQEGFEGGRMTPEAEGITCATIDTAVTLGLDVLCDDRPALIGFTRQMLLEEYARLLPADRVIVEILKSVPGDTDVLEACCRLRKSGYPVVLGNFEPNDPREPLVPFADYLKVDQQNVAPEASTRLVQQYSKHCKMLAGKVEKREDFWRAKAQGFHYFQGYFFREPQRMRARQIPASQATYMQLLQAIAKPELEFSEIEKLIKREASLCYRLLRYLNSPAFGAASQVESIHHALALLGEREIIRWIRMAATLVMGKERPSDLVLSSLVRARFCELLAPKVPHGKVDLFLMGMFSLMDAILEVPIGILIDGLALDPETKAELVAGKTGGPTPMAPLYKLMVAREAGDWESVASLGKQLNLSLYNVAETYNEAMRWAHHVNSSA